MRCILLCLVVIGMASCSTHNERWYMTHPKALQKALDACPEKSLQGFSCQQLKEVGKAINQYALILQRNPQAFGQKIIAMQTKIVALQQQLNSADSKEDKKRISSELSTLTDTLRLYMITVRLFESPEG